METNKKLIPMTDFVLQRAEESILPLTIIETFKNGAKITNQIFNYANFLNKRLELGMFIPCDEDGNILEKFSKSYKGKYCKHTGLPLDEKELNKIYDYNDAKENVLFDKFNFKGIVNDFFIVESNELTLLYSTKEKRFFEYTRIESLVYKNLTLSEIAIKQLEL